MLTVACANCGKEFGAQRKTAIYCSVRCRTAAVRARQRLAAEGVQVQPVKSVPPRREGAAVIALPPVAPSGIGGFVGRTRRILEQAGALDSYPGMAALFAAEMLDSGVQDTMSSMASMLKEYKVSMREALADVPAAKSPLDEIREALKLA